MELEIPNVCLVVLVGASSAGKSTFAQRHFQPAEIVSSDALRRMVSNEENDQEAGSDAFDLLHRIVAMRLKRGLLTVVDATNLHRDERRPLLRVAREQYVQPAAVVFDLPEALSQQRNRARPDRDVPPEIIHRHARQVEGAVDRLKHEGFTRVYRFETTQAVDQAEIRRTPLAVDFRYLPGPFDVIGDVHGCTDELEELLGRLGYARTPSAPPDHPAGLPYRYTHPERRTAVFVGDLVDRGPRILDAVHLVAAMAAAGDALVVPGNHDDKLLRWLKGNKVEIAHGLENSIAEIEAVTQSLSSSQGRRFLAALREFFDGLPSHVVLDGGRLAVAHAGVRQRMIGREARRVRDFALYGEVRGETDADGLPVRYNWARDYHGETMIVYGHTPVTDPAWENNTINIDTGCVYGGRLTALRYPEGELVAVPARRQYHVPKRKIGSTLPASSDNASPS